MELNQGHMDFQSIALPPEMVCDTIINKPVRLATRLGVFGQVVHALAPRVAEAENVRAALMLVARGETPLGVVYGSDARAQPAVRVVATFPENTHPPIVYPVARIAASRHPEAAKFVRWLSTPAAASARVAAWNARSPVVSPSAAMWRWRMPVRAAIHSSLVSTIFDRSSLVKIFSGR